MLVIECATMDYMSGKEARRLWHITDDEEKTLCGYNNLYLFTGLIELVKRNNLCPDCYTLARVKRKGVDYVKFP